VYVKQEDIPRFFLHGGGQLLLSCFEEVEGKARMMCNMEDHNTYILSQIMPCHQWCSTCKQTPGQLGVDKDACKAVYENTISLSPAVSHHLHQDIKIFLKLIHQCQGLKNLSCRGQKVKESMFQLAPALQQLTALQYLDLATNDLGAEGASALAHALHQLTYVY
jgi:hypothetical protein